MSSDELRRHLEQLGDQFDFGEYEIEAYLAVLDHGELTASEIADRTSIPQPRVYDTIRTLSDRGVVELHESRPIRVVALDPEEVFPAIQRSLAELITDLSYRYTSPSQVSEAVTLVKSRPSILRYIEQTIESAQFELVLSLTPTLLDRFEALLAETCDRGVACELLVTPAAGAPSPDEFEYMRVSTATRIRRGITTPVIAVADGTRSVYATQDALENDTEQYGVIFNRSALGFLVSGFFNTVLWTTATPLATDGHDRPFPRRYASIRRCLRDLQGSDPPGTYYVAVRGRDVETGERRSVSGSVSETALENGGKVAQLTIETDEGPVTVGGRVAALEGIEAHEIHVDTDRIESE